MQTLYKLLKNVCFVIKKKNSFLETRRVLKQWYKMIKNITQISIFNNHKWKENTIKAQI
jgi:hypothetical protein